ncbi:MAG: hypothetical protein ACI4JU_00620 [Angelakisella sp.]
MLLTIVMLSLFLVVSSAVVTTDEVYLIDFDGNIIENPDLSKPYLYGAVFNADGTRAPTMRATFVNNYGVELSAGQSWRSYQYATSSNYSWVAGGNTYEAVDKVRLQGYGTNTANGTESAWQSSVMLTTTEGASNMYYGTNYSYFRAVYTNTGSSSVIFHINIWTE